MIIFRTTMNVFLDKRTEVMQTLLSMIEPIENVRGCLSCHVFRDIEEKNVLLGTKSLLCEPLQIEIHTVSHTEGMETVKAARGIGT
jgi:hypothetical protein